jgi:2-polyprenyl-3-methyl-5-hydroxy-6-metoxy-1,4-benzoquinol methylase
MNHFDHLLLHVPDLPTRRILDLGSGRGKFLFYCLERGVHAVGLEYNPEYIAITKRKATEKGVPVEVYQGKGESLPFADETFDFLNISEVIEHVKDPEQVIKEAWRVLSPLGYAYLSAPNRFGLKDPHFHAYFVNWLPRSLASLFLTLTRKHKDYSFTGAGEQRLEEMHYYTLRNISKILTDTGFAVTDQRITKLHRRFPNPILFSCARLLYLPLRFAYFDSFHLLIQKTRNAGS